jgi:hypothetical protein
VTTSSKVRTAPHELASTFNTLLCDAEALRTAGVGAYWGKNSGTGPIKFTAILMALEHCLSKESPVKNRVLSHH